MHRLWATKINQFRRTAFKHSLKQQHIILKNGELVSADNFKVQLLRIKTDLQPKLHFAPGIKQRMRKAEKNES